MNEDNKRGQNAAISGLALQAALAGLLCTIWLLTQSPAARAAFLLMSVGPVIWLIVAALFYSRRLAEQEAEELSATERGGLFEAGEEIRMAERRLNLITRWMAPLTTLLVGGGLLAMALWLGRPMSAGLPQPEPIQNTLVWAFFCLGGSFLGFLFSRYAVGMASDDRWRVLRAGGGFLTVGTLAAGLLCAAFFLEHLGLHWGLRYLPAVVMALMGVLGVEMLANLVLDFYRPRAPGTERRFSFDSRLAAFLSEPENVAHSIAETMNYQFGFEVSSTWFYQLLRKTLAPLLLFGLLALVAISTVVIVGPEQKCVVLTWGRTPADKAVLSSGLHLKAPWPIQTVDRVDADRIRTMLIGVTDVRRVEPTPAPVDDHGHKRKKTEIKAKFPQAKLELWKEEHGDYKEYDILVARRPYQRGQDEPAAVGTTAVEAEVPEAEKFSTFGLLRITIALRYKVKDVYAYLYDVNDPETLLRDVATRELTRYAARRDVDMLLNRKGQPMARAMHEAVSRTADELGLGVEIVEVCVQGVHPPPDLAEAFEGVLQADLEKTGVILKAATDAESRLSAVAGSARLARDLADAQADLQHLRDAQAPAERIAAAQTRAHELLDEAGGEIQAVINQGTSDRWSNVNAERGRWLAFENQLAAYKAAPELYRLTEKLNVFTEALKDARKYVLGIDTNLLEIRQQDDRRVMGGGFSLGGD